MTTAVKVCLTKCNGAGKMVTMKKFFNDSLPSILIVICSASFISTNVVYHRVAHITESLISPSRSLFPTTATNIITRPLKTHEIDQVSSDSDSLDDSTSLDKGRHEAISLDIAAWFANCWQALGLNE